MFLQYIIWPLEVLLTMLRLYVLPVTKLLLTKYNPVMRPFYLVFKTQVLKIQLTNAFIFRAGSNQPPRFLNYFFSTYLLIYEDMPVGESEVRMLIYVKNRVQIYIYNFHFKMAQNMKMLAFQQQYYVTSMQF